MTNEKTLSPIIQTDELKALVKECPDLVIVDVTNEPDAKKKHIESH